MPQLRNLVCHVEWCGVDIPLQEHDALYHDGFVETFIAVPSLATPFQIRLKSTAYIAAGLAMFVYIDGAYQCNRNRQNLMLPNGHMSEAQVKAEFCVKQKEEFNASGRFNVSPWRFKKTGDCKRYPSSITLRYKESQCI